MREWLTHQLGRPEPVDRRPPKAVVDEAIARIAIGGWPAGLFGRRDALLVLLRHRAWLTHRQLIELTSDQLTIDQDRRLHIGSNSGHLLEPTDEPGHLPGLHLAMLAHPALPRHPLHHHRKAHRTARAGRSEPQQPCLPAAFPARSAEAADAGVPADRPLGSMPLPLRPATTRSTIALAGQHLSDRPPVHPTVVDLAAAARLLVGQPERLGSAFSLVVPYEQTYTAGLAARQQALEDLSETGRALDDTDAAVDALNARIAELDQWLGH